MKPMAWSLALVLVGVPGALGQQAHASDTAPQNAKNPPLAKTESEKRILSTAKGELYANVPAADGRMLRLLAEAIDAKIVVEIGTSTGISAMWFCIALEKTGGRLTTFELDPGRAALARAHFKNR